MLKFLECSVCVLLKLKCQLKLHITSIHFTFFIYVTWQCLACCWNTLKREPVTRWKNYSLSEHAYFQKYVHFFITILELWTFHFIITLCHSSSQWHTLSLSGWFREPVYRIFVTYFTSVFTLNSEFESPFHHGVPKSRWCGTMKNHTICIHRMFKFCSLMVSPLLP